MAEEFLKIDFRVYISSCSYTDKDNTDYEFDIGHPLFEDYTLEYVLDHYVVHNWNGKKANVSWEKVVKKKFGTNQYVDFNGDEIYIDEPYEYFVMLLDGFLASFDMLSVHLTDTIQDFTKN